MFVVVGWLLVVAITEVGLAQRVDEARKLRRHQSRAGEIERAQLIHLYDRHFFL